MHKIKGVQTALVTPFDSSGNLNEESLREIIKFQLKNLVDGIVVLGTTGEAPTLNHQEKKKIIEIAIQERNVNQSTALITVGTGCYSTHETIENTKKAEDLGADAALVVVPYYNKPTQQGLLQHFTHVAKSTRLPIIVYNIAGRTGQNLSTETLQKLKDIPNIAGVKEASGNILQMMDVYAKIVEERKSFCLLSGDDALTLPIMSIGGCGVISVVSNLVPDLIKELLNTCVSGDFEKARKLHYHLLPLFKAAFIETNPIPIKYAMNSFGMNVGSCRLPLCDLLEENEKILTATLKNYETCTHG